MKFIIETEPKLFLDKYLGFIKEDIEANNLLLGLINNAIENKTDVHCFAVEENTGEVLLLSLQLPPNSLIFSISKSDIANRFFVDEFCKFKIPVTSLVGEKNIVEKFVTTHNNIFKNFALNKYRDDVIYSLSTLDADFNDELEFSFAELNDAQWLAEWKDNFNQELLDKSQQPPRSEIVEYMKLRINKGAVAVLKLDNVAVATASYSHIDNIARINFVYTSKEFRKHGYAKELVKRLTDYILNDKRLERCVLISDADDKAANALYKSVGYKARAGFTYYVQKEFL